MSSAAALRRQAELQAAQRARDTARACATPGCGNSVAARSASPLCTRCWQRAEGLVDSGGKPHQPSDMPTPPVRMSHGVDQPTSPSTDRWRVDGACLLCGSTDVERRDQRGIARGRPAVTRQLVGLVPGVPFLVGVRCARCEDVVRANRDKVHPVVAAVFEQLGRADFDVWGLHVVAARMAGLPDPEPPAERWGFTEVGPLDDTEPVPEVLSNAELTAELARLRSILPAAE